MSNDLISRSAFIKEINEHMKNVYECDIESVSDFQDGNKSEESYIVQGLFEAFELISNVPTAYNVDKVVERLEDMRLKREEQLRTCADNDMADYFRCKMSAIAEAIEIVKSGGIAEEKKAEWKEHFASRFGRIE